MRGGWLLRKELTWSRHQAFTLVILLIVLPGIAAVAAMGFQSVLPEDTPVAVVAGEGATADDVDIVAGALTTFSDPVRYDSRESAFAAMDRERVYAVVVVPPGLTEESATPTVVMYTDGDMVPYQEPSIAVANVAQFSLQELSPATVTVERVEQGQSRSLPEYLVPSFLMLITLVLAFAYFPRVLDEESKVAERIRVESSLGTVVGAKLLTLTVLMIVPMLAAAASARFLNYDLALVSVGSIIVYGLTFVYCGASAAIVMVLSRFQTWGRLINLVALLVLGGFSGLVYPVGFFSPLRRSIVRLVPVHHSMIIARGHTLRDMGVFEFEASYGLLVVTTVTTLVGLKLALSWYEWRI